MKSVQLLERINLWSFKRKYGLRDKFIMQKKHASVRYVHSRVSVYHSSRVELKWQRSLHHCPICNIGSLYGPGVTCGAIHYGRCTSVTFPFQSPKNFRKKHGYAAVNIPVAKVIPTRPVQIVEPEIQQSDPKSDYDKTSLNIPKESKDIIPTSKDEEEDYRKNLEKDNTESHVPSSFTTATPTITTVTLSDTAKDNKSKRKENVVKPRTAHSANIPKFYHPVGKPLSADQNEKVLQRVSQEFSKMEEGKVFKDQMGPIVKACNLPLYWKAIVFHAAGGEPNSYITLQMFTNMWKKVFQSCHDEAARFVKLVAKPDTNYLEEDDFFTLIQDVVDTHPGLTFLQEAPEFHSRYINTVIARTFYTVNRSWSGKITIPELRKSNFLQTLSILEEEDDINQITDFFSYEHFYVIYCKFWELDKDHDLLIDKADLARHNDHAISLAMIDRIFSGCVTRGKAQKEGKMTYQEFVWFLMSEEDKRNPRSIEYWFRCMDFDGDGVISMYEMEYFYDEQMRKMESIGIEKLPFEDCLCQMLDLVRPKEQGRITLADLKNCKMTNIFFDTFFNLDKFLEHEQRDPFSNLRDMDSDGPEPSDWEKYAAEEYEILVAEEGANEQEEIHYEDDFEPDDEEIIQEDRNANLTETLKQNSNIVKKSRKNVLKAVDDDIYDFSPQNLGY
ncbi:hypothetical protein KUTeg_012576 [Tegillarca granosa]|uniref:EF-hand domain-containing protein n=1 Tax=Tegillarca granosa TaxID=220873 RepID=A0ABQ9F2E6_TEGGR|nr:hypothetical protein KUTeg_012576 [Tegillarca granosa]